MTNYSVYSIPEHRGVIVAGNTATLKQWLSIPGEWVNCESVPWPMTADAANRWIAQWSDIPRRKAFKLLTDPSTLKTHEDIQKDAFLRGYFEAALWSSNDESDESGGEPLDKNYDVSDISDESVTAMALDCEDFQTANAGLLQRYFEESGRDDEHAGHDFWLTRNGHGTGYWDRGLPDELGESLSDAAKAYGECNLSVQDGKIYCE